MLPPLQPFVPGGHSSAHQVPVSSAPLFSLPDSPPPSSNPVLHCTYVDKRVTSVLTPLPHGDNVASEGLSIDLRGGALSAPFLGFGGSATALSFSPSSHIPPSAPRQMQATSSSSAEMQSPSLSSAGTSLVESLLDSSSAVFAPRYKRRFLVLTSKALYWFNRSSTKDDLFGENVGSVKLKDILYVRGVRCSEGDGPADDDGGEKTLGPTLGFTAVPSATRGTDSDQQGASSPRIRPNGEPIEPQYFYFQIAALDDSMTLNRDKEDGVFVRQFRVPSSKARDDWVSALGAVLVGGAWAGGGGTSLSGILPPPPGTAERKLSRSNHGYSANFANPMLSSAATRGQAFPAGGAANSPIFRSQSPMRSAAGRSASLTMDSLALSGAALADSRADEQRPYGSRSYSVSSPTPSQPSTSRSARLVVGSPNAFTRTPNQFTRTDDTIPHSLELQRLRGVGYYVNVLYPLLVLSSSGYQSSVAQEVQHDLFSNSLPAYVGWNSRPFIVHVKGGNRASVTLHFNNGQRGVLTRAALESASSSSNTSSSSSSTTSYLALSRLPQSLLSSFEDLNFQSIDEFGSAMSGTGVGGLFISEAGGVAYTCMKQSALTRLEPTFPFFIFAYDVVLIAALSLMFQLSAREYSFLSPRLAPLSSPPYIACTSVLLLAAVAAAFISRVRGASAASFLITLVQICPLKADKADANAESISVDAPNIPSSQIEGSAAAAAAAFIRDASVPESQSSGAVSASSTSKLNSSDPAFIPIRFITGTVDQGGRPEAERRWRATVKHRIETGTDSVLHRPIPFFEDVKANYPQIHVRYTKPMFDDGKGGKCRHIVYFDCPGLVDIDALLSIGLERLKHFQRFMVEFVYTYYAPYEHSKLLNVVDISGFKLTDLKGERLEFFKYISALSQEHYPERASIIAVINAPVWFSVLFKFIKPMISESTQKKIRVYSQKETLSGLCEFIDRENIPVEYGGDLVFKDPVTGERIPARKGSELEKALSMYVRKLNAGELLPRPAHFNREDVLDEFRAWETKQGVWDSNIGEEGGASDIHLPVEEQRSKFALACQTGALKTNSEASNECETEVLDDDEEDTLVRSERLTVGLEPLRGRTQSESAPGGAFIFNALVARTVMEGWIFKKATGAGVLGTRTWSERWAKLVRGANREEAGMNVLAEAALNAPLLLLSWTEITVHPSVIYLDDCTASPVDRQAQGELKTAHCLDLVHTLGIKPTRSFYLPTSHERDKWVNNINDVIAAQKKLK